MPKFLHDLDAVSSRSPEGASFGGLGVHLVGLNGESQSFDSASCRARSAQTGPASFAKFLRRDGSLHVRTGNPHRRCQCSIPGDLVLSVDDEWEREESSELTWSGGNRTPVTSEGGRRGGWPPARTLQRSSQSPLLLALYFTCIGGGSAKAKENAAIMNSFIEEQEGHLELPLFDLSGLANATGNFSIKNKFGEGGFGPVYKGLLKNGQEISIKRLCRGSVQGLKEFKNEIAPIVKLQHRNLVKLHRYCIHNEEKMLVYEYMPKKSLDFFIFDFGLARILGGDQIAATTRRVVGTYGYMAPEYAIDGNLSVKSDVFSFGVLLLEILSEKKNKGNHWENESTDLIGYAWDLWTKERPLETVDDILIESCNLSQVLRCIHISLLCLEQHPYARPDMSSVIMMFGSEIALPKPKRPALFIGEYAYQYDPANEFSIEVLESR
nr:G-type lectin S-receptor-like serine/threonine-protein kinase At4g27290 [Arachis hypogaea]